MSFFGSGNVDICSRSTGFNDLALDMHEVRLIFKKRDT